MKSKQLESGFSLVEILVILVMAGILASIAYPSIMGLIRRQSLNLSNNQIYQAITEAQTIAKAQSTDMQISLKEEQDQYSSWWIKWAVHQVGTSPSSWNYLEQNIKIDETKTDFQKVGNTWQIQFDYKGYPKDPTKDVGIVTLKSEDTLLKDDRRCVSVATLLGSMLLGRDQDCQ